MIQSTEDYEQLLPAAKAGDHLSLQRLLVHHARPITRLIRRRLPRTIRHSIDADDVLQLAWMGAFRDIRQMKGSSESEFAAWLRSIAEHRLHDAIRRASRLKRGGGERSLSWTSGDVEVGRRLDFAKVDRQSPSENVCRQESIDEVRRAMRRLPHHYRRAVELRFLRGLSLEETSKAMDYSPRAVQGLLDRARKAMREMLKSVMAAD